MTLQRGHTILFTPSSWLVPPTSMSEAIDRLVQVYIGNTSDWIQVGSDINVGDKCTSVSLSEDGLSVCVGSSLYSSLRGIAIVYDWNGTTWTKRGSDFLGEGNSRHGTSVSIKNNGNTIAIGAPIANVNDRGQAEVYEYNGTTWSQKGTDINGTLSNRYTGNSVSLSADGNTVAIGSPGTSLFHNGFTGIYDYDGTNWTQRGGDIDGGFLVSKSGFSVSMSGNGNLVAIGAPRDEPELFAPYGAEPAGSVHIYEWNGASWALKGSSIDGLAANDRTGESVEMTNDGSVIIIGSNGSSYGHTRVYFWNGNDWAQKGMDITGEQIGDLSGSGVSISDDGNIIAIGDPGNDGNGYESGQTRVFSWDGTNWIQTGSDIFGDPNGMNGESVSLSSNGKIVAIATGSCRVYKLNDAIPS